MSSRRIRRLRNRQDRTNIHNQLRKEVQEPFMEQSQDNQEQNLNIDTQKEPLENESLTNTLSEDQLKAVTQGVIIPASCVNQLVLRPSVLKAIKENRFHIYAVGHVTGATKVLLKTQWGEPDDNTSISGKICDRLDAIGAVKNLKPWWHLW